MSTLYMVGNGFDRAHGLKTQYIDFRTFLEKYHGDFLCQFEDMYNVSFFDPTDWGCKKDAEDQWKSSISQQLWGDFEENIGHPDENSMYSEADAMDGTLPSRSIKDTLDSHWQQRYGFSTQLQKFVLEWLHTIDISNISPQKESLINNSQDYFLSFNYTPVLEQIYHAKNVLHIHGAIPPYSDVPPIMGHGNKRLITSNLRIAEECLEDNNELLASIYQAIVHYARSIYKDTDAIIANNEAFFSKLNEINTIECIGLSFSDVDIPYLLKIMREVKENTKWILYYYDKSAHQRLHNVFSITGITHLFEVYFRDSKYFWD